MKRLDEIEARTNAATEGPWMGIRYPDGFLGRVIGGNGFGVAEDFPDDADAEFIAHARQDVPALVAVARYALSQHSKDEAHNECGHCADSYGEDGWPCSTVREIHRLLGGDT